MADLSWISALTNQGGGGGSSGGVSDYDQLKNRPVTNIAGTGTVISALETGVYNIEGTWKLTPDDIERETLADDLFYVMNNGAESKLTWISAGQIKTYGVPVGGTAADISTRYGRSILISCQSQKLQRKSISCKRATIWMQRCFLYKYTNPQYVRRKDEML
mgnify:CR=1 FL=1